MKKITIRGLLKRLRTLSGEEVYPEYIITNNEKILKQIKKLRALKES